MTGELVDVIGNDLAGRLPTDQVFSIAWQHRRLAAEVGLRQAAAAAALFKPAWSTLRRLELGAADAWGRWWSNASFGMIGRLPSARKG